MLLVTFFEVWSYKTAVDNNIIIAIVMQLVVAGQSFGNMKNLNCQIVNDCYKTSMMLI